ncbi:glycosyltransferase family 8 protein [Streptococcus mitis]|uniref:glycosyltransferase family 8 protein n=1 Tax=Streptococcus mitis TaxID=28037 RepID=UPI0021B7A58C|nr:glycosyltransferase family 8 protein [Streptococcus mitis]
MRKTIVLVADNAYLIPLETTIKSVLYHNKDVDFYILNNDIAPEWFKLLGKKMEVVNSTIKNIYIDKEIFEGYKTGPHINYATYFRFFAPEVVDADRILYIDSDLIVTGDLSPLFEIDFQGYSIGAVDDYYAYEGRTSGFNAGVLLMNVAKWKEYSIVNNLLELAAEKHSIVHLADQSILNIYFENNWLELDKTYNYMVGVDISNLIQKYERLEDSLPVVVHFASHDKPWNTYSISRLRELWWTYRDLDWSEIAFQRSNLNYFERSNQSKKQAMLVTWSADVKHLEYLLQQLPDWHFHVAAPVYCNKDLTKLSVYSNMTLYQSVLHQRIDWLLDDSSIYLDINMGEEVLNVVTRARERGMKVFAFETTRKSNNDENYDGIFSVNMPKDLVDKIKNIEI